MLVLREGTDTSQGTPQLLSNIAACLSIAATVASTLGPRGMDKLIVGADGHATISNDGATILRLLDVVHPAAKSLVDIARAQDAEVGDGTTSVVLLAAELLREAKQFVEDGVSPHVIIKGYRTAARLAIERVNQLAVTVNAADKEWGPSLSLSFPQIGSLTPYARARAETSGRCCSSAPRPPCRPS